MRDLPIDIVRYDLLSFLNLTSAMKLTQASQLLFHTLRHKIRQTQWVTTDRFMQQSHNPQRISVFTSVYAGKNSDLQRLLQHIALEHDRNLYPLLHLYIDFSESMDNIVLPASLQTLIVESYAKQAFNVVIIPSTLHSLILGDFFNQSLVGVTLPTYLSSLVLGAFFNQPLVGVTLPANLHTLSFGKLFNQSLIGVSLPDTLQTLTFGHCFNHSLIGILPRQMKQVRKYGGKLAGHLLPPGLAIVYL